jgi:hypothetical protein
MILTAIGWLVAILFAAVTGWRTFRMLSVGKDAVAVLANWTVLALQVTVTMAALTLAGAAGPDAGAVVAGIAFCAAALTARAWTVNGLRDLAAALREALTAPAEDARELMHWVRRRRDGGSIPAQGSAPAVVADAITRRSIPSILEDAALGPMPEPAELLAGHGVAPAPYASLAQFIAGFEPEDDMALRMFMEGNAAGSVLIADAWHAFADTCLNSVGLDPAYVAGILEAGDSAGGHGSLLAQIHKRFGVIYGAVKEWVSAHGPLPHKAREFLTGDL